jgi:uncharacterized membrane protein
VKPALIPRWLFGAGLLVAVAATTHLLAVWALPRLIMQRALSTVAGDAPPAPVLAPPTDHTQRQIVMPSPDLRYAVCVWDVSERPLRIRAQLGGLRYGSIALYAANSDNFLVINDRQPEAAAIDLVLVGPKAYASTAPLPAGARTVSAPSTRGLLLMRVLVGDPDADAAAVEAARGSLRCEPI